MLETLRVPLVGYQCDNFLAHTVFSSGIVLQHRINDMTVLARMACTHLQLDGGMLLCAPVPEIDAVSEDVMHAAIERAHCQAKRNQGAGNNAYDAG